MVIFRCFPPMYIFRRFPSKKSRFNILGCEQKVQSASILSLQQIAGNSSKLVSPKTPFLLFSSFLVLPSSFSLSSYTHLQACITLKSIELNPNKQHSTSNVFKQIIKQFVCTIYQHHSLSNHPNKLSNSLCAQAQIKYKTQPIVIHKSQTFGGKDFNIQISTLVKGNI